MPNPRQARIELLKAGPPLTQRLHEATSEGKAAIAEPEGHESAE